eukprot:3227470-Pyramimonas_sp.AAC.1
MCAALSKSHIWKRTRPQSVKLLQTLKRMCAALRREQHVLKRTRPPSVKWLPMFKLQDHIWRGHLRQNARPALKSGLGVRQGE